MLEFILTRFISTERMVSLIINESKKANQYCLTNECDYYFGDLWEKYRFDKDVFQNQKEVTFEGYNFKGTNNPHKVLTYLYGDYMKLPPEEERVPLHHLECYVDD